MCNEIGKVDLDWLQCQVDGWGRLRPYEAEEIVELTLVEYAKRHAEIAVPRHWLLATAKRVRANYVRQCARYGMKNLDSRNLTASPSNLSSEISCASAALAGALQTLTHGQRAMVEMCDIGGMTVSEAAGRLDVPYETAKSWRSRAKARLRRRVEQQSRSIGSAK